MMIKPHTHTGILPLVLAPIIPVSLLVLYIALLVVYVFVSGWRTVR